MIHYTENSTSVEGNLKIGKQGQKQFADCRLYCCLAGIFIFALFLMLAARGEVSAQALRSVDDSRSSVFADVLCFKGDNPGETRTDVFLVVPYQTLSFRAQSDQFVAKYKLDVVVRDRGGNRIDGHIEERFVVEEDYEVSMGATAAFDVAQVRFSLRPDAYTVEANIEDAYSKQRISVRRGVQAPDFDRAEISMSTILLASSIVESAERRSVTPFISDDITELLQEGFFLFFEIYATSALQYDSLDIFYRLTDEKGGQGEVLAQGRTTRVEVSRTRPRQTYMRFEPVEKVGTGMFAITVYALPPGATEVSAALAATERAVTIVSGLSIANLDERELNLAIRQSRYATYPAQISEILDAPTLDEKRRRFEEFWQSLDPTPGTRRNEAFDEYFSRVEHANANFRSYNDGWMTDMGMVYIIFGQPLTRQRRLWRNDGRYLEVWQYGNNFEFIFVDNTGFGDYRLTRPIPGNEIYRYRR